jgi:chemotaxis protein histidine kinase CheA
MAYAEPGSDPSHVIALIARRFAADMPARVAALREIAVSDRPGTLTVLRREAHNLAGVASTLGFSRTGDAAAALEAITVAALTGDAPTSEAAGGVQAGAAPAVEAIAVAFAAEAAVVLDLD